MNKYNTRQKYGQGWFLEPTRHSLARRGIRTGRKSYARKTNFLSMPVISYVKLNYERWGDVSYFKEKDIPYNLLKYKNMLIHFTDKKNVESIKRYGLIPIIYRVYE